MSYIRTEWAIFEVVEENELVYRVKAKNKKNIYSKSKCQTNVIKQADTIEELCDGVIVEDKFNPSIWFDMLIDEFKQMSNEDKVHMVQKWNYYLYIKTNKGLIYVAKMNDKGELELL